MAVKIGGASKLVAIASLLVGLKAWPLGGLWALVFVYKERANTKRVR